MRRKKVLLVIILIVVISIGFSAISASLSITGNSSIARNTWDVHFENVQVTSGSVTAPTPVISNNDTQVTYNVTLNMPGDYFEFTVDAVNEGTIDAMIQTFSNTGLTTAQQKYLDYSITYDDGVDVANKHLLAHGDTKTYKVRVNYRRDLEPNELPASDQTIALSFSVTYEQADSTAIATPVGVARFTVSDTRTYVGQAIPNGVNARLTPMEAMADWSDILGTSGQTRPFYLKHLMSNDIIVETYVEFVISPEMAATNSGAVAGTYAIKPGSTRAGYDATKELLLSAFGSSNCTYHDSSTSANIGCSVPEVGTWVAFDNNNFSVSVDDRSECTCNASINGVSYCKIE